MWRHGKAVPFWLQDSASSKACHTCCGPGSVEQVAFSVSHCACHSQPKSAVTKHRDAARDMEARADGVRREAEAELARVRQMKSEAEQGRDRIIAEAQRKGQEMLEQARMAAQRECTELRRAALEEIKAVLARVETIRAAADEGLETQ